MAALWPGSALADETATTWRAGDLVTYRFACHDVAAMTALARSGGDHAVGGDLQADGRCAFYKRPILARLEEWIAGPFAVPPASVWRVLDVEEDTEFLWVDDASGPHALERAVESREPRT